MAYDAGNLVDVVYADDTLLIGTSDVHLNEFLHSVASAGSKYGMELHYGKLQLLQVQTQAHIRSPANDQIPPADHMQYLGATLDAEGRAGSELARRMGTARGGFNALRAVWNRSALTWRRKLRIFNAVVESKLLYSLGSLCLTKSAKTRLDGFQNRCIRQIIGIKPAFVSRVSNIDVLQRAGCMPASGLLERRQLELLGKILRSPPSSELQWADLQKSGPIL